VLAETFRDVVGLEGAAGSLSKKSPTAAFFFAGLMYSSSLSSRRPDCYETKYQNLHVIYRTKNNYLFLFGASLPFPLLFAGRPYHLTSESESTCNHLAFPLLFAGTTSTSESESTFIFAWAASSEQTSRLFQNPTLTHPIFFTGARFLGGGAGTSSLSIIIRFLGS
jgi:hypothetical protein